MVEMKKNLTEEEKQIMVLRDQIRNIRNKGKFMNSYVSLRKKSNEIRKDKNITDADKKKALVKVCEEIIKEIMRK